MEFSFITEAGKALIAKNQGIKFTRIALGSGEIVNPTPAITNLRKFETNAKMMSCRVDELHKAHIDAKLELSLVKQEFFWRECGLYAMDTDVGEILYTYAYSTKPDFIAAADSGMMEEILVSMVATVGSNTNVDVTIDTSMVLTTKKEFMPLKAKVDAICVSVNEFGAKGDGVADDTKAIQDAIDYLKATGGTAMFDGGTYVLSKPIVLPSSVILDGGNKSQLLSKRRNDGAIKEVAGIDFTEYTKEQYQQLDACIVTEYNARNIEIKNLDLKCEWQEVEYGILVTYFVYSQMNNINLHGFDEGIRVVAGWNNSMSCIRTKNCVTYGVRFENQDNFNIQYTSWNIDRVFVDNSEYAYKFHGLQYSSLNAVCADHIKQIAYWFRYSYAGIQGLGCEASNAQVIKLDNSNISINGMYLLGLTLREEKPTASVSNALFEICDQNRFGVGLTITSADIRTYEGAETRPLYYVSARSFFSLTNSRVWDDANYDPSKNIIVSGGRVEINNYRDKKINYPLQVKTLTVDEDINGLRMNPIISGYGKGTYAHMQNTLQYTNVGDGTLRNQIILDMAEVKKVFPFADSTDRFIYLPLKITVKANNEFISNVIYSEKGVFNSNGAISSGELNITSVNHDAGIFKIDINKPISRYAVIIQLA